ncbi:MAG: hypothetical protein AAFV38_07025, partial [Pseudomonadota bacterium]
PRATTDYAGWTVGPWSVDIQQDGRTAKEGSRVMMAAGVAVALDLMVSGKHGLAIWASAENFDFLPFLPETLDHVEYSDMMVDIAKAFQAEAPVTLLPVDYVQPPETLVDESEATAPQDDVEAPA